MMRQASIFLLAVFYFALAEVATADSGDVLDAKSYQLKEISGTEFVFESDGQEQRKSANDFCRFGLWKDVPRGAQVLLTDGSVLIGDVLKIADEKVLLGDTAGLGRCRFEGTAIPLASVRGILYQPAAETLVRDRRWMQIQSSKPTADIVHLVGGEALSGLCLGSKTVEKEDGSPLPLKFQLPGVAKQIEILPARIEAVAFNSSLLQLAKSAPKFWLGLNDGNWLACKSVIADDKSVTIKTVGGLELRTPLVTDDELTPRFWQAVSYLESQNDKVVYLSDLKPLDYKHVPFLNVGWPYELDRSVVGGRLRTSEGIARKGIGMHAASTLDFEVPADAEFFRAEVAIDIAAAKQGTAIARVLVQQEPDGEFREAQAVDISRKENHLRAISVLLKDARRLRLEVQTAGDGDTGDDVDWCYPRFILKTK